VREQDRSFITNTVNRGYENQQQEFVGHYLSDH
jgi:hypothetical protein